MTSIKLNFDKSKTYAISSLSIDPNIQTGVLLLNVGEALSDKLRTYIEEKKKFNFDLKIYNEDYFNITVPFVKRTDVLINGFKYYDTITQKQETIEYYNYYNHLKRFGFTWEHSPLEFKYEITLSSDEKKMKKILQWTK